MKDPKGRERVGDWMQTFTGRAFWPLDPRADEVDLRDIARGLAMKCRYAGQVTRFYSVAEHCVHVSMHVPESCAMRGLLHDASEAYIGDMIRPLKTQPQLAGFREVEDALERLIYLRFDVDPGDAESARIVKDADNRILVDERAVRSPTPMAWHGTAGLVPLGAPVRGWDPDYAYARYMARFAEIRAPAGLRGAP